MFPIHLKLTVSSVAELQRLTAFLETHTERSIATSPKLTGVSADEKRDLVSSTAVDDQHAPDPTAARGKPSAATTARSPRTAAADPSTAGPSGAAPATSTAATSQSASAASATPQVTYPDLQKAVLTLHKMDPTAAVPIAKSLGADTFKLLKEAQWGDALAAVNTKIAALQAA